MSSRVGELEVERQRLANRVAALEQSVVDAREAARRQDRRPI
jgi:hypothetical protein